MAAQSKAVDNILVVVALAAIVAAILFMLPWGSGSSGGSTDVDSGSGSPSATGDKGTGAASSDVAALRAHFEKLKTTPEKKADYVQVQHILIGFVQDGGNATVPGKPINRTKAEAEALAAELFRRANEGEDFDGMVQQYTDDAHPGIYGMWLDATNVKPGDYARSGMVGAFGDVGWRLEVGGVGVSNYSQATSPYGYHIVKRLK